MTPFAMRLTNGVAGITNGERITKGATGTRGQQLLAREVRTAR